jgi:hypothetical protein
MMVIVHLLGRVMMERCLTCRPAPSVSKDVVAGCIDDGLKIALGKFAGLKCAPIIILVFAIAGLARSIKANRVGQRASMS